MASNSLSSLSIATMPGTTMMPSGGNGITFPMPGMAPSNGLSGLPNFEMPTFGRGGEGSFPGDYMAYIAQNLPAATMEGYQYLYHPGQLLFAHRDPPTSTGDTTFRMVPPFWLNEYLKMRYDPGLQLYKDFAISMVERYPAYFKGVLVGYTITQPSGTSKGGGGVSKGMTAFGRSGGTGPTPIKGTSPGTGGFSTGAAPLLFTTSNDEKVAAFSSLMSTMLATSNQLYKPDGRLPGPTPVSREELEAHMSTLPYKGIGYLGAVSATLSDMANNDKFKTPHQRGTKVPSGASLNPYSNMVHDDKLNYDVELLQELTAEEKKDGQYRSKAKDSKQTPKSNEQIVRKHNPSAFVTKKEAIFKDMLNIKSEFDAWFRKYSEAPRITHFQIAPSKNGGPECLFIGGFQEYWSWIGVVNTTTDWSQPERTMGRGMMEAKIIKAVMRGQNRIKNVWRGGLISKTPLYLLVTRRYVKSGLRPGDPEGRERSVLDYDRKLHWDGGTYDGYQVSEQARIGLEDYAEFQIIPYENGPRGITPEDKLKYGYVDILGNWCEPLVIQVGTYKEPYSDSKNSIVIKGNARQGAFGLGDDLESRAPDYGTGNMYFAQNRDLMTLPDISVMFRQG